MDRSEKRRSKRYRPISAWGYVGYSILYAIPVIRLIFLLIFTFSNGNINRRNYARSYWCRLLISLALTLICTIVVFAVGKDNIADYANDLWTKLNNQFPILQQWETERTDLATPEATATVGTEATETPVPAGNAEEASVSTEFKAAMDSYEEFYDKYIEVFEAFTADPGDSETLASYMSMVAQASDTSQKIDAIDESTLNEADRAYYAEVMARIDEKLAAAGAQR